ncbi:GIY-YIG nuclease family protein [Mesorhizobium sp. B263B2A]|uniref:GIY-YIG nuclease family protein n=1 Tax=Mesorhizobium sp. B263B2A TaxID=2876669 RepID=UPI001CD0E0D8|nr:GIY-YIG nuclease family protein [Mesorhizobium sp. B263B2A]MCA0032759.1 GIY-YIG nuclease family protein [Mesorhizobium sp. B263B2A]
MAPASLAACMAEIKANPGKRYVYILHRPDGTPFYVGKGRGRRIASHERDITDKSDRSRKANIIRSLLRSGKTIGYRIDRWVDSDLEALAREVELIAQLGRLDCGTGPLANATPGGEAGMEIGTQAHARYCEARRSDDARRKASANSRSMWENEATRERIIAAVAEKWSDPHHKDARIAAMREGLSQPSVKEKLSAASNALWSNEDHRHKVTLSTTEAWNDIAYREAITEATRLRWADPTGRTKMMAGQRASFASMSKAAKKLWSNPDHRAERSRAMRELWANPEYRAAQMEARNRNRAKTT